MWCSSGRDSGRARDGSKLCNTQSNWSGFNLVAMILGFVFFWPIGLLMVFWICSGRDVQQLPAAASELWTKVSGASSSFRSEHTDNVVFDDYQQTQYDRIREIKDEIKARAQRFQEFRQGVKRRADEEEFNRFMKDAPKDGDIPSRG